ncbi:MAG: histidine kinase [Pseudomonadota bacterium]
MLDWYRSNRAGAAGVLACFFFGGIEILVLLLDGVKTSDLYTPSGLLAQFVAGLFTDPPSLVSAGTARKELTSNLVMGAHMLIALVFPLLLWIRTGIRRPSPLAHALLALQILLGVAVASSLLYVLAAQLAVILPLRQGRKWLAAEILLLCAAYLRVTVFANMGWGDSTVTMVLMYAVLGMVFQVLVFAVARLAVGERAARVTLARSHASLLATQAMLADTVRGTERTRIARDLHDAVGHHLTALNLHLDLSLRQIAADAPESLHTSRELARTLLTEVREVVNSERNEQRINLRAAIATMCAGIPTPAIRFDYDAQLDITSPMLAHTLFYCVQEALTNAMRHADADLITIDIRGGDHEQVLLTVQDDGCGARGAHEGNGMRGMRERVTEQGGTLVASAEPGYRLAIALPLAWSGA